MSIVSKSIFLSELEFNILQNWYGIDEFTGFEMSNDTNSDEVVQELYNFGVFSLYKKKLIINYDEKIIPSEEIDEIFRILSNTDVCIRVESSRIDLPSVCLFYSKSDKFVIMEPGVRAGEYAKFSVIGMENIKDYLVDTGLLETQYVDSDIVDLIRIRKNDKVLSIKTSFSIFTMKKREVFGSIEIIECLLTDKIRISTKERECQYPYTVDKVVDEIMKMVNENDFS